MDSHLRRVAVPAGLDLLSLLGTADQNIRAVERGFPSVAIHVAGPGPAGDSALALRGPTGDVDLVASLLEELVATAVAGATITPGLVEQAVSLLQGAAQTAPSQHRQLLVAGRRAITAKTPGQQEYLEALAEYPIVFGIGPAGTGKTYLAMAAAVDALLSGEVKRIVLTRPAVEAGENLGFLPGSATEKIDPYLRPLFDALSDLLEDGTLGQLMAVGAIEIAPLAYMRGRTLNDAYIILDEAQNTTELQMKMFLTRLGFRSRMVVTGDDSQIDLVRGQRSGLVAVQRVLAGLGSVKFSYLTSADVVRNPLVAEIVEAYARWDATKTGDAA